MREKESHEVELLALFYVSMTSEDYEGFVLEVKDHFVANCNSG